jgi:hypothetical protein
MEVSGQLHALSALSQGKELMIPTGYEEELAPELDWMQQLKRKIHCSCGVSKTGGPVREKYLHYINFS